MHFYLLILNTQAMQLFVDESENTSEDLLNGSI